MIFLPYPQQGMEECPAFALRVIFVHVVAGVLVEASQEWEQREDSGLIFTPIEN